MKKAWIVGLCLLCSPLASADWLKAMKAYDQENYAVAAAQFNRLLPLGNADAIINLGAMAYQGQGMPVDNAKAMAYFMLAAELKSDRAKPLLQQLQQTATPAQLQQAEQHFLDLQALVKIKPRDTPVQRVANDYPKPLKRQEHKYPLHAQRSGHFGYVALRFLVDEQGDVQTMDVIDSFPVGIFEEASKKAVKKWKYESSQQKHVFRVILQYALEGGVDIKVATNKAEELKLYPGALLDSPAHQYMLATFLEIIQIQSSHRLEVDDTAPVPSSLDLSILKPIKTPLLKMEGFAGNVVVRVAKDGTIVEQVKGKILPESRIKDLIGLKLAGKIEHDQYQIFNRELNIDKKPAISAYFKVPKSLSGMFWMERAAQNGSLEAQRVMAAHNQEWEDYLLSINDGQVLAWVGTRHILAGDYEQGIAMLNQAKASNYPLAAELLQQFM